MTPKDEQWSKAAERRTLVSGILFNHLKEHPGEWPCFDAENNYLWCSTLKELIDEARQHGVEYRPLLQLLSHPIGPAADPSAVVIKEALLTLKDLEVRAELERSGNQTAPALLNDPDIKRPDENVIPVELQTEPMSLAEAGFRMGMAREPGTYEARRKAAGQRARRLIDSGGLRCIEMGKGKGKKYVFDRNQVPDNKTRLK